MIMSPNLPVTLPAPAELDHELLETSLRQRLMTLVRPFVCLGLYAVFAGLGWWLPALLALLYLFLTIVAAAHDLVHRALGLPAWLNDLLLTVISLLVLESGHAYRVSHLQHHRSFPDDTDDPEGDPARMSLGRALLEGPVFLPRLWLWAFRRAPRLRRWLLLEAGCSAGFALIALAAWPQTPALLIYTLLVIVGSWAYPVTTVYLQHNVHGANALFQTNTLRGRVIPRLSLELTYHLEHHLYPAVPSHNYKQLAEHLAPYLREAALEPVRVW